MLRLLVIVVITGALLLAAVPAMARDPILFAASPATVRPGETVSR